MKLSPSRVSGLVDWRGVSLYLAICFGFSWAIEIGALIVGARFTALSPATTALLALVMFVPAASAYIVRRWLTQEGFASAGLRLGPWTPYLLVWIGVPFVFGLIYALTAAFGLGVFSTDISLFLRELPQLPAGKHLPPTPVLLAALGFASMTFGLLVTSLFTFGEEFGWTGYLLPKLLPVGRWRAVLIYGIIWGLWHAPIIVGGFNYPGHPIAGVALMCAFTTAIGFLQCALLIRYKSVVLTSFLHGSINSQARGIWAALFTSVAPLWGGVTGLVGLLLITAVGVYVLSHTSFCVEMPSPPSSLTPSAGFGTAGNTN